MGRPGKKSKKNKNQQKSNIQNKIKNRMEIQLISDLCYGSGGSFGSQIDIDICFDRDGFPYIPARRIKGILKEHAQELAFYMQDPNMLQHIQSLFGEEGKVEGTLKLSDARLIDYRERKEEVDTCSQEDLKYLNPTNIQNYYTSIRTQTSIDSFYPVPSDKKTYPGTAKENSLRTMRIISAPQTFVLEIDYPEKDRKFLEQVCKLVKHMGIRRNRGFGEVNVLLTEGSNKKPKYERYKFDKETKYRYDYLVRLESQVVLSQNNTTLSHDYISGSHIRGYLANQYMKTRGVNEEFYQLFMNEDVQFLPLYISNRNNENYIPTPASIKKVKDGKDYYDDVIDGTQKMILNSVKGYIRTDFQHIKEPLMQMNYHHKRSDDFGVGSSGQEDQSGVFYQLNALQEGQYFKGSIIGKGEYIQKICAMMHNGTIVRVGKSKNTQYGKAMIVDDSVEKYEPETIKTNHVVLVATSPILFFDSESVDYTTDLEKVDQILSEVLNCQLKRTKQFLKFTILSGYNSKWNLAKPQIEAFDAGTVFVYETKQDVSIPKEFMVGDGNVDGFGCMMAYQPVRQLTIDDKNETNQEVVASIKKGNAILLNALKIKVLKTILNEQAIEDAQEMMENNKDINSSFISKLYNNALKNGLSSVNRLLNHNLEKNSYDYKTLLIQKYIHDLSSKIKKEMEKRSLDSNDTNLVDDFKLSCLITYLYQCKLEARTGGDDDE